MTRTDAIRSALLEFLKSRAPEIDAMDDLRGMVVELRFTAGHYKPCRIVFRPEREHLVEDKRM